MKSLHSASIARRGEEISSSNSQRSNDSSVSSGIRRGRGTLDRIRNVRERGARRIRGILDRVRGARGSEEHKDNTRSQRLDVVQNSKLRSNKSSSESKDDVTFATSSESKDGVTFATSAANSFTSTLNASQTHPHIPNGTTWKTKPLSLQPHSLFSIYDNISCKSSSQNIISHEKEGQNPRSPSRNVTKKIRTKSSTNVNMGPLYNAISRGQPLHEIERILRRHSSDLPQVENHGMKILHCAIENYQTSIDVLRLLLAYNLEAAAIWCANGNNSIDLLRKRFVDPEDFRHENDKFKASCIRKSMQEICNSKFIKSRCEHLLLENNELREFWELICEFIYAACHGESPQYISIQQREENLIFDCLELGCCQLLIRFSVVLHPEQLQKANQYGQLPLHVAATKSPHVLETMIDLYPEAAFLTDSNGRKPLQLALANDIIWGPGIESLIHFHPNSLIAIDPITGLPPVFQAATSETADLTTIYNLLSALYWSLIFKET